MLAALLTRREKSRNSFDAPFTPREFRARSILYYLYYYVSKHVGNDGNTNRTRMLIYIDLVQDSKTGKELILHVKINRKCRTHSFYAKLCFREH